MVDVSIYILTYFHEKYLSKAIESVLSQKTKYSYEIIISDDGSMDKTKEIIIDYQNKYPNIIKYNFNGSNLGIPSNVYKARTLCSGRYIVDLAGDDYWIDDYKLEKQISFLDAHKEYDVVCTRMEFRRNEETGSLLVLPKDNETNKEFTIKDYENGKYLNSRGMMMRNFFLNHDEREYFKKATDISSTIDDLVDEVLLINRYRIYTLPDVTDVYRLIEEENGQNYNSKYSFYQKTKASLEAYRKLYDLFGEKISFFNRYKNKTAEIILMGLLTRQFKEFSELYLTIPEMYRKPLYSGVLVRSVPVIFGIVLERFEREIKSRGIRNGNN